MTIIVFAGGTSPELEFYIIFSMTTMPATLTDQREDARHYIPASESDLRAMLNAVGKERLEDLFDHIPSEVLFT
jgi:hypothetical protein